MKNKQPFQQTTHRHSDNFVHVGALHFDHDAARIGSPASGSAFGTRLEKRAQNKKSEKSDDARCTCVIEAQNSRLVALKTIKLSEQRIGLVHLVQKAMLVLVLGNLLFKALLEKSVPNTSGMRSSATKSRTTALTVPSQPSSHV